MAGYLKVIALGCLGADSETRFGQSGTAVLSWRMACTTSYYDSKAKERKERTEWLSCVLFGKLAEAIGPKMQRGTTVFVEGTLKTDTYDDRDGNKRYRTQVVVDEIIIQGGGAQREQGEPRAPAQRPQTRKPPEDFGYSGGKPVVGQTGADYGDGGDEIPF